MHDIMFIVFCQHVDWRFESPVPRWLSASSERFSAATTRSQSLLCFLKLGRLKGKKPSWKQPISIQAVWREIMQNETNTYKYSIQQQPVPFLSFTRRGCLRGNNESVKGKMQIKFGGVLRGHSINNILSNNCLCSWLESYFGSWKPEFIFAVAKVMKPWIHHGLQGDCRIAGLLHNCYST